VTRPFYQEPHSMCPHLWSGCTLQAHTYTMGIYRQAWDCTSQQDHRTCPPGAPGALLQAHLINSLQHQGTLCDLP
jgi:hypothetical protein